MVKTTFSYLEYYAYCIRPKLKEIDLFIKTKSKKLSVSETSNILNLTEREVKDIMKKEGINSISRSDFFKIMENGSSDICRLFKREIESGSPHVYSKEDISYIYNIDINTIEAVCNSLDITEITPFTLPDVFAQIALVA